MSMRYISHPTRNMILTKTIKWTILAPSEMTSPYDNEKPEIDFDVIPDVEIEDER
jgi:hypothetical protein